MAGPSSRPTLKLRAPPGTDEANYGTERYRVDNSGEVEMPDDAVEGLLAVGGFVPSTPASGQFVSVGDLLYANPNDPSASFSWGGVSYTADTNGNIAAPAEIGAQLASHGFLPVDPSTLSVAPPAPAEQPSS